MSCIRFFLVASTIAVGLFGTVRRAGAAPLEIDNFNESAEGWQVYDYNGLPYGTEGGSNVFLPVTWESTGGVGNSGYVWGDHSRWRIDTPERPHSILSFIIYRSWVGKGPLDLRNKKLSVYLRGDQLDLKGANVYFWALNNDKGARFHFTAKPLQVANGVWGDPQAFVLDTEASHWHNSWQRNPASPATLNDVLSTCDSYGFSFVGFPAGQEVTGKFSMDELTISTPEPATAGMVITGGLTLLAVIRCRKRS